MTTMNVPDGIQTTNAACCAAVLRWDGGCLLLQGIGGTLVAIHLDLTGAKPRQHRPQQRLKVSPIRCGGSRGKLTASRGKQDRPVAKMTTDFTVVNMNGVHLKQ